MPHTETREEETRVFHGLPILPRAVRIDMILYSSDLQAVNSRVVPEHGESDHHPVWATLMMPGDSR